MDAGRQAYEKRARRACAAAGWLVRARSAAFVLSLPVTAYLMAVAVESSRASWSGWISLLPLFVAVRALRPLPALLSGAVWGLCLFVFLASGVAPAISPTLASAALLTGAPGLYTGLSAYVTRRIGFNPFVLGVGWMAVELAFEPLGLRHGLLAGAQGDSTWVVWAGRGLGYVLVGFAVAFVNASLVYVLGQIRFGGTGSRFPLRPYDAAARLFPQALPCFSHESHPASQPRGPPAPAHFPIKRARPHQESMTAREHDLRECEHD